MGVFLILVYAIMIFWPLCLSAIVHYFAMDRTTEHGRTTLKNPPEKVLAIIYGSGTIIQVCFWYALSQ